MDKNFIRTVWGTAIRAIAMAAAIGLAVPLSAHENAAAPAVEETTELPLFAIVYEAGPNWTPGAPMAEQGLLEHFYYMRDLHERGLILIAGPRGEDGGLIILRAAGQAQANQVIAADPAVLDGKFVGTATPFVARFTDAPR